MEEISSGLGFRGCNGKAKRKLTAWGLREWFGVEGLPCGPELGVCGLGFWSPGRGVWGCRFRSEWFRFCSSRSWA